MPSDLFSSSSRQLLGITAAAHPKTTEKSGGWLWDGGGVVDAVAMKSKQAKPEMNETMGRSFLGMKR